ncbi:putative glutamyl-tRNA amidotransferase subunit A [Emericellopsis atlantica]|uniref:Glutamyl-tRNA amidotransferase subunit A n=1 Tax=Emericellopsis atlantica TaxID=2614577 RepID=A0A9P7ZQ40_9HYPO|nr:putative glutamyl-tRNA amidotransferase subunit A [Emericellopsis atlantica]KAG9255771.1 putative glutamyl-tRNA amidotransferase subunit A [Emericellopsis atlantica]
MAPAALVAPSAAPDFTPSCSQSIKSHNPIVTALDLNIGEVTVENLQRLYACDAATPADVVRATYRKLHSHLDKAVWITLVPESEALAAAEQLARQYPEPVSRPPLYGVTFSVKDSIDIAGLPTTLACPTYAYTATQTAPVVQRLVSAGAILIGKTNLDQFATGLNGTRSPYGIPRCVHDSDYVSGGSSSGSVVSVAAGLVAFAVATDTAGSTRVPAALNGMVGLKPTLGTISTVGLVPACKTADCITVIAKTVQSARMALSTMRAYDENDVYARDEAQLSVLAAQPSWWDASNNGRVRYALPPPDVVSAALSEPYAALFHKVTAKLPTMSFMDTEHGAGFDYSPFASANAMLYGSSIVAQRLVAFKSYMDTHSTEGMHPVVRDIFSASQGFDAVRAYEDMFTLAEYKRKAARQFRFPSPSSSTGREGIDVLVVPSTATHPTVAEILADPIELNKRLGSFTHFVNLLDLCAVSVPIGGTWTSRNGKKMPFGVTLISTSGRDEDLLQLGQRLMSESWDESEGLIGNSLL